jgi:hypothetical protein
MKIIFSTILLVVSWVTVTAAEKFKLEDFSIQLEQVTSSPSHVWVSSGYTTVNPNYPTVTGVNDFFSPPFAARKFNLRVNLWADSHFIPDNGSYGKGDVGMLYAGGIWYPHKIVRYGTYHHLTGDKLISLHLTSELIPLIGQSGFMEKIIIRNRAETSVEIKAASKLAPGNPDIIPLNKWEFSPPQSETNNADSTGTDVWSNGVVKMRLYTENETLRLAPGETAVSVATVIVDKNKANLPETVNAKQLETATVDAWKKRLDTYTKNIPVLSSNIDGLNDYYKRSLISGLVCIWENPAFALNPFFATSGVDGGGICTYLWDNAGYAPNTVSMMFGPQMIEIARKMVEIDLEKYYAYSLDGSGIGVRYSYSPWSFTTLMSSIFKFSGPQKDLFEYNKKLILNDERRKNSNNLIDYGFQHNLLEMRGAGWEHIVASPNAERSWCLRQLADMGEMVGVKNTETNVWREQADDVITAVREKLWDEDKQWFASIYPNGYKDYVHSIQIFDALWAGACTPEMEKVVVGELRDGAYLGSHGVSSISKTDSVHFEVVDTDWSGGGAYSGDSPQVAMTMYDKGYPEVGWNVLKRVFWMGQNLLYYPQEHFVDRPMAPVNKRANNAAGLTGVEAILFGVLGIQPTYGGELYIHSQLSEGNINIRDFVFKQNHFDVEATTTHLTVKRNGEVIYDGVPKQVKIR